MIQRHQSPQLSAYADLYDVVVPSDHKLRKMNDLIDFSFIYEELESTYSLNYGRSAIDPIRMFKYLLLKSIYPLSDVDLVERSKYDMSFKYFLGMAPEETVINPSSLTKFRKMRLKDVNLLDVLIAKTVEIALDKGIIQSKTMIVDATHTKSRYNQQRPEDILRERSKQLRKVVYSIDETLKTSFPTKPEKKRPSRRNPV
ncbi:transposase [Geomicrobium sp. JCM 19055]|nr:transposase [Geomicrobium sp. JCM 19055]